MRVPQHRRPLTLGLFAASVTPVLWLMLRESGWLQRPQFDLWVLQIWYLSSLAGVVVLGAPFIFLLSWFSRLTWANVLVGSVAAGCAFVQFVVYAMRGEVRADRLLDPGVILEGSILGLVAGIGFCIAAWPNISLKRTDQSLRD